MIIYKATNLINDKCYVGKTTQDFEKYKNKHIREAINEYDIKKENPKIFYDAMKN